MNILCMFCISLYALHATKCRCSKHCSFSKRRPTLKLGNVYFKTVLKFAPHEQLPCGATIPLAFFRLADSRVGRSIQVLDPPTPSDTSAAQVGQNCTGPENLSLWLRTEQHLTEEHRQSTRARRERAEHPTPKLQKVWQRRMTSSVTVAGSIGEANLNGWCRHQSLRLPLHG